MYDFFWEGKGVHVTRRRNSSFFSLSPLKCSSPKGTPGLARAAAHRWLLRGHQSPHDAAPGTHSGVTGPGHGTAGSTAGSEPPTRTTKLKPSTTGSRNAEKPLGEIPLALAASNQTEATGICHCFNRKRQYFGRVTKQAHSLCLQKREHPSLLRELTEETYFREISATTLNWDLFLPCALHYTH